MSGSSPAPASKDLLLALKIMHPPDLGWVFVPELRMGTGYGRLKEQRLDAWAICAWPSRFGVTNIRRAFEIKVSRADVSAELKNPDKRWLAYAVSHEFYFVAPAGLIKPSELARDEGLLEWRDGVLVTTKPPRVRETMPPRWDFVAALARRVVAQDLG